MLLMYLVAVDPLTRNPKAGCTPAPTPIKSGDEDEAGDVEVTTMFQDVCDVSPEPFRSLNSKVLTVPSADEMASKFMRLTVLSCIAPSAFR